MLNLTIGRGRTDCDGIERRDMLRAGTLALGGLSLGRLLQARSEVGGAARDKSIVLLFLTGGPSQIETFDPKMTAASEVRSVTGELTTSLPGVTFGGTFSRLSTWANRMAVVRSFTHENSNHTGGVQDVMRGGSQNSSGIGSIVSRLRGANHRRTGIPSQVYLSHREPDPQFDKERLRLREAAGPGALGAAFQAFDPLGEGTAQRNLTLNVSRSRLSARRELREAFDRLRRQLDSSGSMDGMDHFEQQAFDLLLGGGRRAFDLADEDPQLVRKYDTSAFNTALRVA
ncbi:MAG: DUF1501 domain-containing protein, partial [Planctomycetaceae bacterium]